MSKTAFYKLNFIFSNSFLRNFIQSTYCIEEFTQAYHEVMSGRPNYLVVVLLQRPMLYDIPPELETYLKTHTYIDAQKCPRDIETIRKRIRFAMPKAPLRDLKVCFMTANPSPEHPIMLIIIFLMFNCWLDYLCIGTFFTNNL